MGWRDTAPKGRGREGPGSWPGRKDRAGSQTLPGSALLWLTPPYSLSTISSSQTNGCLVLFLNEMKAFDGRVVVVDKLDIYSAHPCIPRVHHLSGELRAKAMDPPWGKSQNA